MKPFSEINGRLGFGTLRLPKKDSYVDIQTLSKMVDCYLENGFNYFDVAHGYMDGQCEAAMGESLVKRHPREAFVLADKLTYSFFQNSEGIRPLFMSQLKACHVDYFDFYFLHAVTRKRYEKYVRCRAFETISELMREGKIRHFGISFHDKADFLEEILTEHPEIEVVQIQLNYADWESPAIESRKVYEVCVRFDKPVFVMEPVKGGSLHRLPPDAAAVFDHLNEKNNTSNSYASYALRFVAGFDRIQVVLSGMNTLEQVRDNTGFMRSIVPLSEEEQAAVEKVRDIFNSKQLVQCTACRYCTEECPRHILIPDLFSCLNQKKVFNNFNQGYYYNNVLTVHNGKASDCLKCGRCEAACPQKLPIRRLLESVADEFEKEVKDLSKDDPSYKYAAWAVNHSYTYLGASGNFNPKAPVRRIDLAVFLWRIAGRPASNGADYEIADLEKENKFYPAIVWNLSKHILFLDKERKFNPEKRCTRLDLIVYLWRKAGRPQPNNGERKIMDYHGPTFENAAKWAVEKRIATLDTEGKLYPLSRLNRITAFEYLYNDYWQNSK